MSNRRRESNRGRRPDFVNPDKKQDEAATHQPNSGGDAPKRTSPPPSEIQNPNTNNAHQTPEQQTTPPQRTMNDITIARWTRVLAVSTILLFLATAITGIILYKTDVSIQGQLGIMQKQLRLSSRPWVGLSDDIPDNAIITSPLALDANGNALVQYIITTKNFSNAGAQGVMAYARLLVTEDLTFIDQQIEETCGANYIGKVKVGAVLFPGIGRIITQSGGFFQKSEMKSPSYQGKFEAWLVGCIGYQDQFQFLYRTKFWYWLVDPATMRPIEFLPATNAQIPGKFALHHSMIE
jgi:hypothetical protein